MHKPQEDHGVKSGRQIYPSALPLSTIRCFHILQCSRFWPFAVLERAPRRSVRIPQRLFEYRTLLLVGCRSHNS